MILIDGNQRFSGSMTFSESAITLLQTVPPTDSSLRAADIYGRRFGMALADHTNIEGSPRNVGASLTVVEEIMMPGQTLISFMQGIAEGMGSRLRTLEQFNDMFVISGFFERNRDVLLTEISRRQIEDFRKHVSAVEGVNNV